MRALDHPHIVKMLADIPGQDGMYYLVMERVRGGELFDRIVELVSRYVPLFKNALPSLFTLYIYSQINILLLL
jgi:serine/threonine protein kinase